MAFPRAVDPNPTIPPRPLSIEKIVLSDAGLPEEALATFINQLLLSVSNWIGCPRSPESLSATLLITFNSPPLLLIVRAVPLIASFLVLASFKFDPNPFTGIAK